LRAGNGVFGSQGMSASNYMTTTATSKPGNLIQTIERVTVILDVFANNARPLALGDVAAKVNLPKGTTHRILASLIYFGFVRQDQESRNYALGFKLVELGASLLDQIDVRKEAEPFLHELSQQTKETVYLVLLDGPEVVYVEKIETEDSSIVLRASSKVGQRSTANSCAVGKSLLAYLPAAHFNDLLPRMTFTPKTANTITDPATLQTHLQTVRQRGYAIDDEENEAGIRCVAAPILNERGQAIAALSVSGPTVRLTHERLHGALRNQVMATALKISHAMGYRGEFLCAPA